MYDLIRGVRGPVIGKTLWRGTGSLPMTPLITPNKGMYYYHTHTREREEEGADSPAKRPLIFVANEVSGTVAVFDTMHRHARTHTN